MTMLVPFGTDFLEAVGQTYSPERFRSVYRAPSSWPRATTTASPVTPSDVIRQVTDIELPEQGYRSGPIGYPRPPDVYTGALKSGFAAALRAMKSGKSPYFGWGAPMGGSVGSGGYGPAAYGVKGMTGLDWQRGKAPMGLQTLFYDRLKAAFAEMRRAGLGTPRITDGFRSLAAQMDVYRRKRGIVPVARPGTSVHGLGFAADLALTKAQFAWLKRNGARFGLWNLPSESWHWQLDPRVLHALAKSSRTRR